MGSLRDDRRWAWAATAAAIFFVALAVFDTVWWHPGYAWGDETDIISYLQRAREGMPTVWMPGYGSLHKQLVLACMDLWPGRLWASSVPALVALAVEAFLLFLLARRWQGSRAGFFAVLVGLGAAFTLIRARVSTSFSIFPAEWLFMIWARPWAAKAWQKALWGSLLGILCFDYEAWLPTAALFMLVPLEEGTSWRGRLIEAGGLLLTIAILLSPEQARLYLERRRAGSFLNGNAPSAGFGGLKQLLLGGATLPYFAPRGHGTLPLWEFLLLPLGLVAWVKSAWRPALHLALGLALTLAGGAAYGLPAHRVIAAWPLMALVAAMGLDRFGKSRGMLWAVTLLLSLGIGHQLWVWARVQSDYDVAYRGPVRDLQRMAQAGVAESRRSGAPFLTELHATKGPEVRFLAGATLPLAPTGSTNVLAYLPWEYLPALKSPPKILASFREGSYGPALLVELSGSDAKAAAEAERELRPVFLKAPMFSLASARATAEWLEKHPEAGAWSRTLGQDFLGSVLQGNNRVGWAWVKSLEKEELVSVRPLVVALTGLKGVDSKAELELARRAHRIDLMDARVRRFERDALLRLGLNAERLRLEEDTQALYLSGRLLAE